MKKILLFLLIFATSTTFAQRSKYTVGTNTINLGVGLNSTLYENNYSPSFSFSYDRGIMELGPGKLGVGAIFQYQTSSFRDFQNATQGLDYSFKSINIGARGTYHPDILNTNVIDIYGIFMFGYSSNQNSATPFGSYFGTIPSQIGPKNGLNVALAAGARLYIKPKIGIFGEFGYDISPIKLGLTAKF